MSEDYLIALDDASIEIDKALCHPELYDSGDDAIVGLEIASDIIDNLIERRRESGRENSRR